MRSRWARRFRDLPVIRLNDLGGPDAPSGAERPLFDVPRP